jgi:predicted nucleic acid-binding protein
MKILARARHSVYLCEISLDELNKITCKNHYDSDIGMDSKFNVAKQWEAVEHAQIIVRHKEAIEESYRRALKLVENLKLEELQRPIQEAT